MSFVVQIPEELYTQIAAYADRHGQQPDALITSWLADAIQQADATEEGEAVYDPSTDPLARFAGIFAIDEPGWADRHDEYFGGKEHYAQEE